MDWFCFVDVDGMGGVNLDADLLARLGTFPIHLDLDIYGMGARRGRDGRGRRRPDVTALDHPDLAAISSPDLPMSAHKPG
jgi:hypothetical protein